MERAGDNGSQSEVRRVVRVRVDRIGVAGDRELWWVALAFADESTQPEGLYTDRERAMELGQSLARRHEVRLVVSNLA